MSMTTKLGGLVTCHEELQPIMLTQPLGTWSCETARQTKTIIFTLPQFLWPQN